MLQNFNVFRDWRISSINELVSMGGQATFKQGHSENGRASLKQGHVESELVSMGGVSYFEGGKC
jgi:hypothetical protein